MESIMLQILGGGAVVVLILKEVFGFLKGRGVDGNGNGKETRIEHLEQAVGRLNDKMDKVIVSLAKKGLIE